MMGDRSRWLRVLLRDMALGAMLFLTLPGLAIPFATPEHQWTVLEARAGEAMATRAVEVTAPPGPGADNAIVAAAQLRPASDPLLMRRLAEAAVLCLTFSLLFALNLAFWRHLRRVDAVSRLSARRSRRLE